MNWNWNLQATEVVVVKRFAVFSQVSLDNLSDFKFTIMIHDVELILFYSFSLFYSYTFKGSCYLITIITSHSPLELTSSSIENVLMTNKFFVSKSVSQLSKLLQCKRTTNKQYLQMSKSVNNNIQLSLMHRIISLVQTTAKVFNKLWPR